MRYVTSEACVVDMPKIGTSPMRNSEVLRYHDRIGYTNFIDLTGS
jgi:hypothetical protein